MGEPLTKGERTRSGRILTAEKRRIILAQYAAGATAERIAEHNGWAIRGVSAIIKNAIDRHREDTIRSVESVRVTQLQRLDTLLMAVWPKAVADPPNLAAVREVLRIEKLRADIAGTLRAPEGSGQQGGVHFHVDPARVRELEQSFTASLDPDVVEGTAVEVPQKSVVE